MSTQEATLIAACLAVIAALGSAVITFWNGSRGRKREALSEIASHRIRWIEELRNDIAEFLGHCLNLAYDRGDRSELLTSMQIKATVIMLKLNKEEHKATMEKVWALRGACYGNFEDDDDREKFLALYREIPRFFDPILKKEWRRSKDEIKGVTK